MNIEDIILKKDNSLSAKAIRGLLTPLSWLYILVHIIFFIPYRLGIRKKHTAPLPVISVGNITMGGTGKTPFVITLTNILKSMGYRPVIFSRGYGRENTSQENLLFEPGSSLTAKDTGDEPQILSKALNVPIIIGRSRIKSLKLLNKTNADIIVLDDGMQYWQLKKDIEIGIASLKRPFGSGAVIPSGDLREPKRGLKRCSFIILTSNGKETDSNSVNTVKAYCPDSFVYQGFTSPYSINYSGKEYETDFIRNKKVFAFSGIANPDRFISTLRSLGAEITDFQAFPDHHNYTEEDINLINQKAEKAEIIVTTAKDSVKLPKDLIHAVVNIYTDIDSEFKKKLAEKL